jgi:hypothetical protein
LNNFSTWLANSKAHDLALWLLTNVPGSPPVLQTLHLLSISVLMASSVFIALRIVGLAVPSQSIDEMVLRLRYWTLAGLCGVFSSGIWFVLARPARYFSNPVFQIKFSLLLPALVITFLIYRIALTRNNFWQVYRWQGKFLAALCLLLWIAVVLSGRWIAYSEYLFWSE